MGGVGGEKKYRCPTHPKAIVWKWTIKGGVDDKVASARVPVVNSLARQTEMLSTLDVGTGAPGSGTKRKAEHMIGKDPKLTPK
jgi:hypothetical protein